ncbi:MAG: type II CAAX prenyl endopeptidase Rce1 family protein, partial [Bradymonadaceae bacterium]
RHRPTAMAMTVKSYLAKTRDPYANLILVLPLFVAYQFGILLTGGVRNGVDFMTDLLFLAAGQNLWTYLAINLGIILAFVVALVVMRDKGNFKLEIWPWVIGESTIYALFLGTGVITIMRHLGMGQLLATGAGGHFGLIDKLVLSIGAGMYEELVFRLILTGGLFWLARRVLDWTSWMAAIFAVIASSLAFSGVHYIGSMADTFQLGSFLFRFFAGVILAVIYYLRGFAVAVYTHAIYDIMVMVFP